MNFIVSKLQQLKYHEYISTLSRNSLVSRKF
jgi:hypothetical protein